jgi:hypothetical protein
MGAPREPAALLSALIDLPGEAVAEALRLIDVGDAYESFEIPKLGRRDPRVITAPKEPLKRVQRALIVLLEPLPVASSVHGFRRGRSIVTGAKAHVNARALISIDLSDFFHSVPRSRVERALARSLEPRLVEETKELSPPEGRALVALIARLCTWPVAANKEAVLPQGSPSSPHLANLAARPLDTEIAALLRAIPGEYTYTRYADDLTISAPHEIDRSLLGEVLRRVERSGFRANPEKVRIASTLKGSKHFTQRLMITGLMLDPRDRSVRIPRPRLDRYRAQIHQAANLPHDQLRAETVQQIEGIVSFVHMVYGRLPPALDGAYQRFLEAHQRPRLVAGKSRRFARRKATNRELYR